VIYTLKDILTTISNGENQTVEFKTSFQKEVIESVVAFANSYGGRVFIGVEDIIEQYGSGIKRIKDECKVHGVKEPKFEEFVHGFRVTIYKEKSDVGVNVGVNEIYEFIKLHQPTKANVISENYPDITQRTIERYIKQLKEDDKIEFRGSSRTGGYYRLQNNGE